MALIPALFFSIFFLVVIVVIALIAMVINKIGISILASKMNLKNWGFLWLPLGGSYFDGLIAGRFIKLKHNFFPILCFMLRAIPAILYLIFILIDAPLSHEPQFSDYIMYAAIITFIIGEAEIRAMKIVAMCKGKCNVVIAMLIGLFLPDFWSYFMVNKVKNSISE